MRSEPVITESSQHPAERESPASEPIAGDFFRDSEPGNPEALGTSYLERGQGSQSWRRWREIQSNFVDDPQSSVSDAHQLVSELIDGIVEQFQQEQRELEKRWSSGDQVSTEDLRLCLQRYRDFFGRLLPTREIENIHRSSQGA